MSEKPSQGSSFHKPKDILIAAVIGFSPKKNALDTIVPPLSIVSLAAVSVIQSQPQSKNVTGKISEINSS